MPPASARWRPCAAAGWRSRGPPGTKPTSAKWKRPCESVSVAARSFGSAIGRPPTARVGTVASATTTTTRACATGRPPGLGVAFRNSHLVYALTWYALAAMSAAAAWAVHRRKLT